MHVRYVQKLAAVVDQAHSSQDAEMLLLANSYDLIISDLNSDEDSGSTINFLSLLTNYSRNSSIIIVSGAIVASPRIINGVPVTYLIKPVTREQMLYAISQITVSGKTDFNDFTSLVSDQTTQLSSFSELS